MKHIIILISLLIPYIIYSQERVSTNDIFIKKKLAYRTDEGTLFNGITEFRKNNGHLVFEEEYIEGYKIRYTLYYNFHEIAKSDETFYHEKSFEKKHAIRYSLSNKGHIRHTFFDEKGKKTLEETYEDGKLIYRCEYLDNKKHGAEFCTKNEEITNNQYVNGKRIKD